MRFEKFPRIRLTALPTPLQRAERLEAALGPRSPKIFIKRDDLTGLAFGGNKARKLEYLVADAMAKGATVLVTTGAAQSNHARQTAGAAVLAGMKCVLVLDARFGAEIVGNLLLDHLLGADVRLVENPDDRLKVMADIEDELAQAGEVPYVIPVGGSVPIGCLGYVNFVLELEEQTRTAGIAPSHVYFASGSAGTQSGLIVGSKLFGAPWQIHGVSDGSDLDWLGSGILTLSRATAELLELSAEIAAEDVTLSDPFPGVGYSEPANGATEAIRLLAQTEAIFLDPVYTGKAMAGLIADIRSGALTPDDQVVFVHTSGGPSLFVHGEALLHS
jgi:D-cysteine desulfhydrase family pyridoxal phosphate-dependent enzyme